MLLADTDAPDELVIESDLEKLRERADVHLSFLYNEHQKFTLEISQDKRNVESEKNIGGPEKPEPEEGLVAWFDKQETASKPH